jgi:uncharacterized protein (DUF58 family)
VEPTSYSDPKTLGSLQHLKLRTQAILESLQKGQHLNPRPGYSIEFAQHREYTAGDDLRYLDWKALARSDRLYVKQFQDETALTCYLAVDNSQSMSFQGPHSSGTKYDFAALMASCLAWLVVQQRDAVGLSLLGGRLAKPLLPSDDPRQWNQVVELLQQGQPGESNQTWLPALAKVGPEIQRRGVLFLISDWLDDLEGLDRILRRFRESLKLDVRVIQVLDPEELEPTLQGRVQLQDLENGGRIKVHAERVRQAYAEELDQFLEGFKRLCHRYGARYVLARTDEAMTNVLHRALLPAGD